MQIRFLKPLAFKEGLTKGHISSMCTKVIVQKLLPLQFLLFPPNTSERKGICGYEAVETFKMGDRTREINLFLHYNPR